MNLGFSLVYVTCPPCLFGTASLTPETPRGAQIREIFCPCELKVCVLLPIILKQCSNVVVICIMLKNERTKFLKTQLGVCAGAW